MHGKGSGDLPFVKLLRAHGVTVLTDQHIAGLAVDNRRVTGVVMSSGETIGRKGLILAIGAIVPARKRSGIRATSRFGARGVCIDAGVSDR